MKKAIIATCIGLFLATGCTIGFSGRHGQNLVIVPALPYTVELDDDRSFYQDGYYYNYQGNVWVYSGSRQGPWLQLPRSHYPRNVHFRVNKNRDRDNRRHN